MTARGTAPAPSTARLLQTRIIATVGPSCGTLAMLRQMVKEGVSVFRFNFSHGTLFTHELWHGMVRQVASELGARVETLQDLAGHRVRTGELKGRKPVVLKAGQPFLLYQDPMPGDRHGVALDYRGSFRKIPLDQMVYIDDGKLHLKVVRSAPRWLETVVIQDGVLGSRKGVNMPGAPLSFPLISDKDIRDLRFAVERKVDYVALSFVRSAADVHEVRRRLKRAWPKCRLIAKIEDGDGVHNFDRILRAADGIMIARGDLGISVPIEEIPILQKWMITTCNHVRKPAITATQMLEHMTAYRVPTRAEVTDVANAVIDGTDFVMLSGETAAGRYPVETVSMMRRIVEYTERHMPVRRPSSPRLETEVTMPDVCRYPRARIR